MTDHVPPVVRSAIMAAVHPQNSGPELAVRKRLHALGYRYRLHAAKLPGRPDIVFPGRKKVVFVHGCFWHRHENCRFATMPKTRTQFWRDKFARNLARDERDIADLEAAGWKCHIVWQCELKDIERAIGDVVRFLEEQ
ncbi:very short patch repair endonuclease [Derxia lacustris]|uniref:very short patch repair endonuclease n=1 Tax=Derxia lacustris TaxID=764842 RepID=UPI000A1758FA|nr:DNA mismatch endonuclease Vsr [Derxia lacustris]